MEATVYSADAENAILETLGYIVHYDEDYEDMFYSCFLNTNNL